MVTPIIPTLRKQTDGINEFEDNLGYIVTPYFKKKKRKRKKDPTTLLLQKYLCFLLLKLYV